MRLLARKTRSSVALLKQEVLMLFEMPSGSTEQAAGNCPKRSHAHSWSVAPALLGVKGEERECTEMREVLSSKGETG